jgi:hypothetical protein
LKGALSLLIAESILLEKINKIDLRRANPDIEQQEGIYNAQ